MISLHQTSIFDARVQAIVNPANSHLAHGGGLARAIAVRATEITVERSVRTWSTPELADEYYRQVDKARAWEYEQETAELVPIGGATVTSAGLLPYEGIIHAVGPIWGGGSYHEEELLVKAYRACFLAMELNKWSTVAMPAISAGIFGVPEEVVARCAHAACVGYGAGHRMRVEFYTPEDHIYEAFVEQFKVAG